MKMRLAGKSKNRHEVFFPEKVPSPCQLAERQLAESRKCTENFNPIELRAHFWAIDVDNKRDNKIEHKFKKVESFYRWA